MRQESGAGNRLDIGVRGSEPGRGRGVVVLEDGAPIAANPYAEPDLLYAPPVAWARAMEVHRGAAGVLYGFRTAGGVIDLRTIDPPDRLRIVADAEAGTPAHGRALLLYGDKRGAARWLAQMLYQHDDGPRATPVDQLDGLGKLVIETAPRATLTLKLGAHAQDGVSDAIGLTDRLHRETPRRPTLAPDDRLQLGRADASLAYVHRGDKTTVRAQLYANALAVSWRRQEWTRAPEPGVQYARAVDSIHFAPASATLARAFGVVGFEPRVTHAFGAHTIDAGARALVEAADFALSRGAEPLHEESHASFAGALYARDRVDFGPLTLARFASSVCITRAGAARPMRAR